MTDHKARITPGSHAEKLYRDFSIEKLINSALYYNGFTFSEKAEMERAMMAKIQDLEEATLHVPVEARIRSAAFASIDWVLHNRREENEQ